MLNCLARPRHIKPFDILQPQHLSTPAPLLLRASPWATPGGVGLLQIVSSTAAELSQCLAQLCGNDVAVGNVQLRSFFAHPSVHATIDTGLVARLTPSTALLMPHGGLEVMREIEEAVHAQPHAERELSPAPGHVGTALLSFPEARSAVEALALAMCSRALSPLAVDVLLAQHDRWERVSSAAASTAGVLPPSCALRHLLAPPTIVLVGAANIGKSTLLNALASQPISIVADEPGTTRDHVGALINCDGLAVHVVDTPGLRETDDAIELAAQSHAADISARADMLLLCHTEREDARANKREPLSLNPSLPYLRLALRADLALPSFSCDLALSNLHEPAAANASAALALLTRRIREMLVPTALLQSQQPWQFWQ